MINEPTRDNPRIKDASLWRCEDLHGSEIEVSWFLYALVRLLKPQRVVETGTYTGQSTWPLLKGVLDNRYGDLFACDVDPDMVAAAKERIKKSAAFKYADDEILAHGTIEVRSGISLLESFGAPLDLVFIDSGTNLDRELELTAAAKKISRYGVIALHDTAQARYPNLEKIQTAFDLREFYMNTPRGLTLLQKKI